MHRLTTAAFLLALIAGALPAQQMMGKNDKVFELTQRIARGSWVRISSPNGQIAVTQGSGDQVELRAEKILRGGSVEDVEFAVYKDNDGLTVCAVYEGGETPLFRGQVEKIGVAPCLTVKAPDGSRLRQPESLPPGVPTAVSQVQPAARQPVGVVGQAGNTGSNADLPLPQTTGGPSPVTTGGPPPIPTGANPASTAP